MPRKLKTRNLVTHIHSFIYKTLFKFSVCYEYIRVGWLKFTFTVCPYFSLSDSSPLSCWMISASVSLQSRRFLRARKCFCSRKRHVETLSTLPNLSLSWKIEDGGYNNTNTNNVSPTQNTPALQAMPLRWSQCTFKRCYVTDIVEHFNQLLVAFLFVMELGV